MSRADGEKTPGDGRAFTPPRSVGRVLAVVRAVAGHDSPVSFAEIADQSDVPRTTLFAILKGLARDGYLVFEGDRYRLGPESIKLGQLLARSQPFPESAMPVLKHLLELTEETVILSELADDRRHGEYRIVLESENALRFSVKVGTRRPLNSSAGGQVLLAFLPADERERYLASGNFERFTDRTVVTESKLRSVIETAREMGYAVSIDGSVLGAMAIAAPWFASSGDLGGAVIVGAPTARVSETYLELVPDVVAAGESISRLVGYTDPYPRRIAD